MGNAINIAELKAVVLAEAHRRAQSAAHGGEMSDGGASILENQVAVYEAGQKGEVPESWMQFVHILDPEWEEYQRLSKKFIGKHL